MCLPIHSTKYPFTHLSIQSFIQQNSKIQNSLIHSAKFYGLPRGFSVHLLRTYSMPAVLEADLQSGIIQGLQGVHSLVMGGGSESKHPLE